MADIRDKVAAYLARTGMPEEEFGKLALGRADFVKRLAVQRRMTLDTADRLLRFMGEAPIGPEFVREVEVFLEVTGIRPARFGIDATGEPNFVKVIRTRGTTRLGTVDLVRAHMRRTADTTQRTVIAGMLEDGGRRSSAVAAGTVSQRGKRRCGRFPSVRRGHGCRRAFRASPPGIPHHARGSGGARRLGGDAEPVSRRRHGTRLSPIRLRGHLCVHRSPELGVGKTADYSRERLTVGSDTSHLVHRLDVMKFDLQTHADS